MNRFSLLILLMLLTLVKLQEEEDPEILFNDFIIKYNRHYLTEEEYKFRFEIFKHNLKKINEIQKKVTHKVGITKFCDLTDDEMKMYKSGLSLNSIFSKNRTDIINVKQIKEKNDSDSRNHNVKSSTISHYDLREQGFVNQPRNQFECGSCSAFASLASLEAYFKRKTGQLFKFSEQQLLDCIEDFNCVDGSNIFKIFLYLYEKKYIIKEGDYYQYSQKEDKNKCPNDYNLKKKGIKIENFSAYYAFLTEKKDFRKSSILVPYLVNYGPLYIQVNSDALNLKYYSSGIINADLSCDSKEINSPDHAVNIVGYEIDQLGREYWIVRNSWGAEWGENGYFRMLHSDSRCNFDVVAFFDDYIEEEEKPTEQVCPKCECNDDSQNTLSFRIYKLLFGLALSLLF